jgi:hypothetical protein
MKLLIWIGAQAARLPAQRRADLPIESEPGELVGDAGGGRRVGDIGRSGGGAIKE